MTAEACTDAPPVVEETPKIRNVILMIGDGMGPQQVGLLELYARYADDPRYPDKTSHLGRMMGLGETGVVIASPANGLVNDSAAGATQIGSGVETNFGYVGLDADGETVLSAVAVAKSLGLATGIVSDTRITHATPASFGGHVHDRWDESTIAAQLLETAPDVLLSGGWRYFLPKSAAKTDGNRRRIEDRYAIPMAAVTSKRNDERNLLDEAEDAGYNVITYGAALEEAQQRPVLGLFAANAMESGTQWFERSDDRPSDAEPTLKRMTERAIALLHKDSPGFFLMVEGGQIDWAGHNNEAQRLLYEMLRFDEAIASVLAFAEGRDDTVVIVTADHETGGFSIHYDRSGPPTASLFTVMDRSPNYISWATTAHTHTPVLATAIGPRALIAPFDGVYHQSEVGRRVLSLVRLAAQSH